MKNTFLIAFFLPCPSKLTTFALKIQLILRPFRLQKIEFPRRHCKLIFNTIQPQANKLHEMGARRIFYIKVFLSMYTYIYCTIFAELHGAPPIPPTLYLGVVFPRIYRTWSAGRLANALFAAQLWTDMKIQATPLSKPNKQKKNKNKKKNNEGNRRKNCSHMLVLSQLPEIPLFHVLVAMFLTWLCGHLFVQTLKEFKSLWSYSHTCILIFFIGRISFAFCQLLVLIAFLLGLQIACHLSRWPFAFG